MKMIGMWRLRGCCLMKPAVSNPFMSGHLHVEQDERELALQDFAQRLFAGVAP